MVPPLVAFSILLAFWGNHKLTRTRRIGTPLQRIKASTNNDDGFLENKPHRCGRNININHDVMASIEFGTQEFWNLCSNMERQQSRYENYDDSDNTASSRRRIQELILAILKKNSVEDGVNVDNGNENPKIEWKNQRDCTPNGDGCSVLHYACINGATDVVAYCLKNGSEPNLATFTYESTPLKWAASKGHADIVQQLLLSGADPQIRDFFGYTPLQYACLGGFPDVVSILLGVKPTTETMSNDDGQAIEDTADLLKYVSTTGHEDVNAIDDAGFMPLHYACSLGRIDVVETLLELGAFTDEPTEEGRTPLFFATGCGHEKIVSKLLDWGAYIDGYTKTEKSINHVATPGWTTLHEACEKNQVKCAELLLKLGANIDICNTGKETPLMITAQRGNFEVAKLLLEKGADCNLADDWNTSPLHEACRQNHKRIVSLLIENGADVNSRNNYDETPLHVACWLSRSDIGLLLMENGANVEARNKDGKTPLDYAKQRGHSNLMAELSINFQNQHG